MTDDEIRDEAINHVTRKYRYGEEEFSYIVVGTITEQLGIDDEFVTSELVEVWLREFQLAISNTISWARATASQDEASKRAVATALASVRAECLEPSAEDLQLLGEVAVGKLAPTELRQRVLSRRQCK